MENIDKTFADSVRKAIMDFGPEIVMDRRLIGIIKDYQGFNSLPPAEHITRHLIESGKMSVLLNAKEQSENQTSDTIRRLISNFENEYGFAQVMAEKTIFSILIGMGVNVVVDPHSVEGITQHAAQEAKKAESNVLSQGNLNSNKKGGSRPTPKPPYTPPQTNNQGTGNPNSKGGSGCYMWFFIACMVLCVVSIAIVYIVPAGPKKEESIPVLSCPDSRYDEILRKIESAQKSEGAELSENEDIKIEIENALTQYPNDYWLNFLKEKIYGENESKK